MKLLKTEKTEKTVTLTVTLSKDEFEVAKDEAFNVERLQYNVEEFTNPQIARNSMEEVYGKNTFTDHAVKICCNQAFEILSKEQNIKVVPIPTTEISDTSEDEITITITAPIYPKMSLKAYKGIEVSKIEPEKVGDDAIDEQLQEMAKQLAEVTEVSRKSKEGDTLNFDFEGFVDGVAFDGGKAQGFDLILGSNQFIPGFEEQLIGTNAGQDLDVLVTFPAEYHAKELASKETVFKCHVNAVKEMIAPEINDEFAKKASGLDTLAEFKADIKVKLEERSQYEADIKFEDAVGMVLLSNLEGEIPQAMIEKQIDRLVQDFNQKVESQGISVEEYLKMNNLDMEKLRALFAPQAEHEIKTGFALEIVVQEENIDITDEEFEAEIQNLAIIFKVDVDEIKRRVPADSLRTDALKTKALSFVFKTAIKK